MREPPLLVENLTSRCHFHSNLLKCQQKTTKNVGNGKNPIDNFSPAYLSYCQLELIELISGFDKIYLLLVRGLDLIIDLIFRYVIQFSSHESGLKRRAGPDLKC